MRGVGKVLVHERTDIEHMIESTLYLLPPSVHDWLPESHLKRNVVDVVSELKPGEYWIGPTRWRGSKAYHPD